MFAFLFLYEICLWFCVHIIFKFTLYVSVKHYLDFITLTLIISFMSFYDLFPGMFLCESWQKPCIKITALSLLCIHLEHFLTSWVCQLTKAIPQNNFLVIVYSSKTFSLELKLNAQAGGLYQQTEMLFITIDDSVTFSPANDANESKPWMVQPSLTSCPLTLWHTWLVSFHGMDS